MRTTQMKPRWWTNENCETNIDGSPISSSLCSFVQSVSQSCEWYRTESNPKRCRLTFNKLHVPSQIWTFNDRNKANLHVHRAHTMNTTTMDTERICPINTHNCLLPKAFGFQFHNCVCLSGWTDRRARLMFVWSSTRCDCGEWNDTFLTAALQLNANATMRVHVRVRSSSIMRSGWFAWPKNNKNAQYISSPLYFVFSRICALPIRVQLSRSSQVQSSALVIRVCLLLLFYDLSPLLGPLKHNTTVDV